MHVASEGDTPPAVLVTGASTGIGLAAVRLLARHGFEVFAGVRREEAAARLEQDAREAWAAAGPSGASSGAPSGASSGAPSGAPSRNSSGASAAGRITPLLFDVTDEDAIARAAGVIDERTGARGLHGLVNNAGTVVAGPMEFLPIEDLRHQLEVNVLGQVAVTQAMLPLLRRAREHQAASVGQRRSVGVRAPAVPVGLGGPRSAAQSVVRGNRGRVVFVGSISGLVSSRLLGAYAASKFAIEALGDAFRLELGPWGLQVAIVEPGRVRTPIWGKTIGAGEARMGRMPDEAAELYESTIRTVADGVSDVDAAGIPPDGVARAVLHALTANRARTRYRVGFDARVVGLLTSFLPDRWMDRFLLAVRR